MFSELSKSQQVTGWFLFLSYVLGSPAMMVAEYHSGLLSERFGYPPTFIYFVGLAQFICVLVMPFRPFAVWSLLALTVLSVGAVWSHLKIGFPITGLPSVGYTALQVWFGWHVYRSAQGGSA